MKMTARILTLAAAVAFASAGTARADITLTDGNATAHVSTGSQSGLDSWTIDGTSQLFQQWFWYRVGNSGPEQSIDTLGLSSQFSAGNTGGVTYSGNGLTVAITFILTGGSANSGTADVAEIISISGANSLLNSLHFFQYADFDLGATPGDDSVQFMNANTVMQQDGSGAWISETGVVPTPSHHEAGLFPTLLNSLNDGSATTLSDSNASGPADVAWAFQWDVSGANGTYIISKDMHIQLPAPGAALLGWMGLGLVGWAKRRVA